MTWRRIFLAALIGAAVWGSSPTWADQSIGGGQGVRIEHGTSDPRAHARTVNGMPKPHHRPVWIGEGLRGPRPKVALNGKSEVKPALRSQARLSAAKNDGRVHRNPRESGLDAHVGARAPLQAERHSSPLIAHRHPTGKPFARDRGARAPIRAEKPQPKHKTPLRKRPVDRLPEELTAPEPAQPDATFPVEPEAEAPPPIRLQAAPEPAASIEHMDVIVEGTRLSVRTKQDADGGALIESDPIFTQLEDQISIEGSVFSVTRSQDRATLSLDFADGSIRANGRLLGRLPDFESDTSASSWLSVNAISVLSGTNARRNRDGLWEFTLDEQLREKFDLELWVEGERQSTTGQDPRTIGPILLIPLKPVVDALGHQLEQEGSIVTVTRIHDSAIISLDLSTGIVSINGDPRGITPDISYADPNILLLPFGAIETLTGTHVTLEPGSSRIDVNLDARLGSGALPGTEIDPNIHKTGPRIHSVAFNLSDRGPQTIEARGQIGTLDTTIRYESIGGFGSVEELEPAFLSVDLQSRQNNWAVTVGDQVSRFRELEGVGVSRLRGASFRKQRVNGTILAIAAGVPLTGTTPVTDRASRPEFGGAAIGARLIRPGGRTELGVSGQIDEFGGAELVLSAEKVLIDNDKDRGVTDLNVDADVGLFADPDGSIGFDARAQLDVRASVSPRVGVSASLEYDGAEFIGSGGLGDTNNISAAGGSARLAARTALGVRVAESAGPLRAVTTSASASLTKTGPSAQLALSGAANAHISGIGVDVGVDATYSTTVTGPPTEDVFNATVRAQKDFRFGVAQATYTTQSVGGGQTAQTLTANIALRGLSQGLGRGAAITLSPTLSAVVSEAGGSAQAGGVIGIDSGNALGSRLSVNGQVSALQSFNPQDTQQSFFASVRGTYRIYRNIAVEASYFDNFAGGRSQAIGLRGQVNFGTARRFGKPLKGRGILTGRVFLDVNRDGIRQEDEPGVPSAVIRLARTRIALRVDRNGHFTIQNLPPGLYDLGADLRSLPLGFLIPEDFLSRATVGEDRITEIDIPVIASGQVRGTVFVDTDESGSVERGEERLEGVYISLRSADGAGQPTVLNTVTFGQFSFENVAPGDYIVTTRVGGRRIERPVTVTEEELFVVLPFGLTPAELDPGEAFHVEVAPVSGAP